MANVVIYDLDTKRVLQYLRSVHTPDYADRTDVLLNPDMKGIDVDYAKVVAGTVRELTPAEKTAAQNEYKLRHYKQLREGAYDPVGAQLDLILKYLSAKGDLTPELTDLIDRHNAIKAQYPKP